jgi:hypothetical protein
MSRWAEALALHFDDSAVRVLAVADGYGRAGGTDLDAGSAVVAATW